MAATRADSRAVVRCHQSRLATAGDSAVSAASAGSECRADGARWGRQVVADCSAAAIIPDSRSRRLHGPVEERTQEAGRGRPGPGAVADAAWARHLGAIPEGVGPVSGGAGAPHARADSDLRSLCV